MAKHGLSIPCALEKNEYSAVDWNVLCMFVRAIGLLCSSRSLFHSWSSSIVLSIIENGVLKSPTVFGGLFVFPLSSFTFVLYILELC